MNLKIGVGLVVVALMTMASVAFSQEVSMQPQEVEWHAPDLQKSEMGRSPASEAPIPVIENPVHPVHSKFPETAPEPTNPDPS